MLVIPFAAFESGGRIFKSTKAWRREAMARLELVEFDPVKHDAIFISHTWWDRTFKDATNDPGDNYDRGAPDYQSGSNKDLKFRVIVAGIRALIAKLALPPERVVLWLDWSCIYQDDKAIKGLGVRSLIKYATLCKAMLIPTEEANVKGWFQFKMEGYGKRGWCRTEFFVLSLWSAMTDGPGRVQLYAAARDGQLTRFNKVSFHGSDGVPDMPAQGDFSVESDRPLVRELQQSMIDEFGHVVIWQKSGEEPIELDLSLSMLHDGHVPTLCERLRSGALESVEYLYVDGNSIGDEGFAALTVAIREGALPCGIGQINLKNNPASRVAQATIRAAGRAKKIIVQVGSDQASDDSAEDDFDGSDGSEEYDSDDGSDDSGEEHGFRDYGDALLR